MSNYWYCTVCNSRVGDEYSYCYKCHPEIEMLEKIADGLHKIMRLMEEHYGRKKKE